MGYILDISINKRMANNMITKKNNGDELLLLVVFCKDQNQQKIKTDKTIMKWSWITIK